MCAVFRDLRHVFLRYTVQMNDNQASWSGQAVSTPRRCLLVLAHASSPVPDFANNAMAYYSPVCSYTSTSRKKSAPRPKKQAAEENSGQRGFSKLPPEFRVFSPPPTLPRSMSTLQTSASGVKAYIYLCLCTSRIILLTSSLWPIDDD